MCCINKVSFPQSLRWDCWGRLTSTMNVYQQFWKEGCYLGEGVSNNAISTLNWQIFWLIYLGLIWYGVPLVFHFCWFGFLNTAYSSYHLCVCTTLYRTVDKAHASYVAQIYTYITQICISNIGPIFPIWWVYLFLIIFCNNVWCISCSGMFLWYIYAPMLGWYAHVAYLPCKLYLSYCTYIWSVIRSNMCTVLCVEWLISLTSYMAHICVYICIYASQVLGIYDQ